MFAHQHFPYTNAHTRYKTCITVFTFGLPGGDIRRNEKSLSKRYFRVETSVLKPYEEILLFHGRSTNAFRCQHVTFLHIYIVRVKMHTRDITIFHIHVRVFRRRYSTEREESLSNDYLKEGTDVLKQKLMRRCRAEELVDRQLASVYRCVFMFVYTLFTLNCYSTHRHDTSSVHADSLS